MRGAAHAGLLAVALIAALGTPVVGQARRDLVLVWDTKPQGTGYVNRPIRNFIRVRIESADTSARASRLNDSTCATLQVRFSPYLDAKVGPGPVQARWTGCKCIAETKWKLGPDAGEQILEAVALKGDTIRSLSTRYVATARALPQLVFGLALVAAAIDIDSLSVTQATLDSAGRRTLAQPIVGFEFPISVWVLRYPRYFVGVSVTNPERNVYTGIQVLPIAYGARFEDFPVQIAAGVRWQRVTVTDMSKSGWNCRFFIAVTTSSNTLLSTIKL